MKKMLIMELKIKEMDLEVILTLDNHYQPISSLKGENDVQAYFRVANTFAWHNVL